MEKIKESAKVNKTSNFKEYQKNYRLEHKDKINEYNKNYYLENKQKIMDSLNAPCKCKICGRIVRYQRLNGHQKTKLCYNNRIIKIDKENVSSNPFKTKDEQIEMEKKKELLEKIEHDIKQLRDMLSQKT